MLQTTAIPTPAKNPVPWITRDLREAGLLSQGPGAWDGERAARLLQILTTAVAALHDDGHPYNVVLSSTGTAATDLQNRIVQVSTSALTDHDLTEGQQASILLGLVLHEVGHIRYHRDAAPAVRDAFGDQTRAIFAISNIAADLHDERLARLAFPGAAKAVDVTLWYVAGKNRADKRSATAQMDTYHGRVNLLVGATRYPWNVEWDGPLALDFLRWAQAWGERCERSDTPASHVARIREALERVGNPPTEPTEPEPDEPNPGRGKGEGKGEGKPRPGKGEPAEGDPDEGEGDGSGDGEDGDGEGEGSGKGEGQPGEGKGSGSGEGEGEGEGDEGDDDADGEATGASIGGGGGAKPRDLDAENDMRIDQTTCTSAKARADRDPEAATRDRILQDAADTWARAQRKGRNSRIYTHPGRYGGVKVTRRVWSDKDGWA